MRVITISREFGSGGRELGKRLADQAKIIRELAEKEDCVIVGRSANVLLAENAPFNIFVYADMDAKLRRCRERAPEDEHLTDREMEQIIKRVDRSRATGYNLISGRTWGDRRDYHLCVNTTGLSIPVLVPQIAEYARQWFEIWKI